MLKRKKLSHSRHIFNIICYFVKRVILKEFQREIPIETIQMIDSFSLLQPTNWHNWVEKSFGKYFFWSFLLSNLFWHSTTVSDCISLLIRSSLPLSRRHSDIALRGLHLNSTLNIHNQIIFRVGYFPLLNEKSPVSSFFLPWGHFSLSPNPTTLTSTDSRPCRRSRRGRSGEGSAASPPRSRDRRPWSSRKTSLEVSCLLCYVVIISALCCVNSLLKQPQKWDQAT